jgi:hypothetical protein
MASTTQAAVKAALKTALLARAVIVSDHVPVSYGEPGDEGRSEQIWIGTAFTEAIEEPRAFRVGLRTEEYSLRVHVENASKPTPEQAEARVALVAAEVEQAVIDSPKLGVAGVSFIRPAGMALKTTESGSNARAIATVTLHVTARLT